MHIDHQNPAICWEACGKLSFIILAMLWSQTKSFTFPGLWSELRRWITSLEDYMPEAKRKELKESAEQSGFVMVNKKRDSSGRVRVQFGSIIASGNWKHEYWVLERPSRTQHCLRGSQVWWPILARICRVYWWVCKFHLFEVCRGGLREVYIYIHMCVCIF